GQQVAHEAGDLGAVEAGPQGPFRSVGVLGDGLADLLLRDLAWRAEVRKRLRHDRRLDAVAEVDAAVAAGVQDLLDRDRAGVVDPAGDLLELGQEAVVVQCHLPEVGLAFAERIRVGALVRDDAALRSGDHLHATELAHRDRAVALVVVRHAAGAVLDAVAALELAPFPGLKKAVQGLGNGRPGVGFSPPAWLPPLGGIVFPGSRAGTLPAGLTGRRSTISRRSGSLNFAIRCASRNSASCGSVRAPPGCSTTNAHAFSPNTGSGIATTQQASTAGCLRIRFSISSLLIFSPPRLMRSLRRPSVKR